MRKSFPTQCAVEKLCACLLTLEGCISAQHTVSGYSSLISSYTLLSAVMLVEDCMCVLMRAYIEPHMFVVGYVGVEQSF